MSTVLLGCGSFFFWFGTLLWAYRKILLLRFAVNGFFFGFELSSNGQTHVMHFKVKNIFLWVKDGFVIIVYIIAL